MARNKMNAKKIEVDNVIFDSQMEARYYVFLKDELKKNKIQGFDLQPSFELIEPYIVVDNRTILKSNPQYKKLKNSKQKTRDVQGTSYIADFKIFNNDGTTTIIDVKGMETVAFKIKRKLFDTLYPDLQLKLVTEKNGKWYDSDELKKIETSIKREKNKIKRDKRSEAYKKQLDKENGSKTKIYKSISKDKVLTKAYKRDLIKESIKNMPKKEQDKILNTYIK